MKQNKIDINWKQFDCDAQQNLYMATDGHLANSRLVDNHLAVNNSGLIADKWSQVAGKIEATFGLKYEA